MITVRFSTGVAVTYNACYVLWGDPHKLYAKDPATGGEFIASVPIGALVEFETPSRVSHPAVFDTQQVQSLKRLATDFRHFKSRVYAALRKKKL